MVPESPRSLSLRRADPIQKIYVLYNLFYKNVDSKDRTEMFLPLVLITQNVRMVSFSGISGNPGGFFATGSTRFVIKSFDVDL